MPVVGTNIAANTAHVLLNRNSDNLEKSLGKISSGSRIVVASDDAAGLAVSGRVNADIAVMAEGARNVLHARNFLQAVDGALITSEKTLQRFKELAAQSLSGAVSDTERGFINAEAVQLFDILFDQFTGEQFLGQAILDGSYNETYAVGADVTTDVIDVDLTSVNLLPIITGLILANFSATNFVDTQANAQNIAGAVDTALDAISDYRTTVGSYISRAEYRGNYLDIAIENLQATVSSIEDVDIAAEQTNFIAQQVLTETAIAGLAQANQITLDLLSLVRQ